MASRAGWVPGECADRALRCLVNRSLVVFSDQPRTYALVSLVADVIKTKKPEVVAQTGDRLEEGMSR